MSDSGFDDIATVAGRMFLNHGFTGVSLRTIASEVGIQAASLYHHCPGGKAELYARAVRRFLDGYEQRLLASRGRAVYPESVLRMATYTLGANHVDLRRIITGDLPHLGEAYREDVSTRIHDALLNPFVQEFEAARRAGRVRKRLDCGLAAACVLAIADNLGGLHLPNGPESKDEEIEAAAKLVRTGISLLLEGTTP